MSSFQTLPAEWQYIVLFLAAAVGTFIVLFCANRIQARRKRAGELAVRLNEWDMTRLAEPLDAYSHGDYSEAVHGFAQLAKDMRTTDGAVSLLETAVTKAVTHYAASNATKAQDLLTILQNGAASKALFSTATTTTTTAAATTT